MRSDLYAYLLLSFVPNQRSQKSLSVLDSLISAVHIGGRTFAVTRESLLSKFAGPSIHGFSVAGFRPAIAIIYNHPETRHRLLAGYLRLRDWTGDGQASRLLFRFLSRLAHQCVIADEPHNHRVAIALLVAELNSQMHCAFLVHLPAYHFPEASGRLDSSTDACTVLAYARDNESLLTRVVLAAEEALCGTF